MNAQSQTFSTVSRAVAAFLFLAIATTAWFLMYEASPKSGGKAEQSIASSPGYEHSQRLSIACARAAMDALGMTGSEHAASYQADYYRQRMQIQADSMGLERWARQDTRRQGLLLEIRSSLAAMMVALDQASGTGTAAASPVPIPLLPALDRVQNALGNYSASLAEPSPNRQAKSSLFSGPALLRELLGLLLVELAILAILFFSITRIRKSFSV